MSVSLYARDGRAVHAFRRGSQGTCCGRTRGRFKPFHASPPNEGNAGGISGMPLVTSDHGATGTPLGGSPSDEGTMDIEGPRDPSVSIPEVRLNDAPLL